MSQPSPSHIKNLYRRLLRELPTNASAAQSRTSHAKLSAPSTLQRRIRETLKNPPATNTKGQFEQAQQFAQYVEAQRMYVTLIERYNPGMGMSEEERVRLSARRVGMNLPVEFETGGGKGV
jgi:ATP synthase assembly factor FMC1